ncbi:MAG TPA: cell wall-binding repeat-containing protein [Actinomycetes bacterium]
MSVLAAGLFLPRVSAFAAGSAPVAPAGTVLGHRVHVMPYGAKASQTGARNASAPAGAKLTYYGGRVVSHVRTVGVLYGPGTYRTYVTDGVTPNMSTFLTGTSNSSYLSWLDGEYNSVTPTPTAGLGQTNQRIGWSTYDRLVSIAPSAANSGTTIQDSQVQSELSAQIVAGHVPAPQKDAAGNNNTDYVVYFPSGTTICDTGACSMASGGFCAYHGTIANVPGYGEVYYTVMPDFTPAGTGCGTDPVEFNNATSVLSHELVETITDPEVGLATSNAPPLAWYDLANGEIGDICNAQQGTILGSDGVAYVVQTEYSNALASCVVSNPSVTSASAITSAASVSFTAGSAGSFTVTTSGSPAPRLSVTGALPSGVSFIDNGDGTATLSGKPAAGTGGSYALTLTAHNGVGSDATQAFTMTVSQASAITSAASMSFTAGSAGSFTVTTSGSPAPRLSVTGALPSGVSFIDNGDGTATVSGTPGSASAGTYALNITAHNSVGADATQVCTLTVANPSGGGGGGAATSTVGRDFGPDRYATSAAIARDHFGPGVPIVFVATGQDFPDALAAGAAAGLMGGPVLLVQPTAIPSSISAELAALAPQQIVVVGGTGAVSDTVLLALKAFTTGPVTRVSGANRYATAAALSARYFAPGVAEVLITTGTNYPDALTGSAAAGAARVPVLLVTSSGIPAETVAELRRLHPGRITILGGPGAVSAAVATSLATYAPTVRRLSGVDRYGTAAAISQAFFGSASRVFLATGSGFADALSAAALAAAVDGPVLLSDYACVPAADLNEISRLSANQITLVGGPGALSSAVQNLTACSG